MTKWCNIHSTNNCSICLNESKKLNKFSNKSIAKRLGISKRQVSKLKKKGYNLNYISLEEFYKLDIK